MIILLGGFGSTNMYYLLQGDHIYVYIYIHTYMYNCNMQLSFIIRIPVI